MTGTRPPVSAWRRRRAADSPSGPTSASGSRRSGQSVRTSTRRPPFRPLAPSTRATARRSLGVGDDLELDVATVPGGHHPKEAAQSVGDASISTDDQSHVLRVDTEREQGLIALILDLDLDRIVLVDERLCDVLQELLHASLSFSTAGSSAGSSVDVASDSGASGAAASAAASAGPARAPARPL